MGGYYTGNDEITFWSYKIYSFCHGLFSFPCVIYPTLSSYIPDVYFLHAVQKMDVFRNTQSGGRCTQEVNRWRRLRFSFCMVNCSTVFVC